MFRPQIGAESFALDAETLAQVRNLLRADKAAATSLARRKHHRIIPDGGSLRVLGMMMDAAPPFAMENSPMPATIMINDQLIAVDPRVAAEMDRLRRATDAQAGFQAALQHSSRAGSLCLITRKRLPLPLRRARR